ncbi:CMRF35-like molecule 7 isoform X2 [Suricata suricatta]|uniref:CMRF35-like molecule 7 isoform X2 n=1 Tax=Suricata suricatta TaxID=37032 RepID=UPI0011557D33|nr:CMRF35-like molecule 7 isoform X2 [Suricata suricatta]
MAQGAKHLLPSVLLMVLASGSWEQRSQVLHKLEGERVSVQCPYRSWAGSNAARAWCKRFPASVCALLATHPRLRDVPQEPRTSIRDDSKSGYFTVTMTGLRVEDSGYYSCVFYQSSEIFVLRNFRLVVSRASTALTTRSTSGTTPWTSATSPVIDSSTVAVVLLLLLTVLLILYLRKARGNATGKGEDKSHIYDSISVQKEPTPEHKNDSSSRQRRPQLSWGSDQQMGSDEDAGAICYASLTYLNHFGLEDSIYVNTHPNPRPTPDPLLTVEYARITGNRPQHSKSTSLEGETQELKADFTGQ